VHCRDVRHRGAARRHEPFNGDPCSWSPRGVAASAGGRLMASSSVLLPLPLPLPAATATSSRRLCTLTVPDLPVARPLALLPSPCSVASSCIMWQTCSSSCTTDYQQQAATVRLVGAGAHMHLAIISRAAVELGTRPSRGLRCCSRGCGLFAAHSHSITRSSRPVEDRPWCRHVHSRHCCPAMVTLLLVYRITCRPRRTP
jgi:hypothetical protein